MPRQKTPKAAKAAIPIRAVDFVMYCAEKPTKTRAWYQQMFGFKRGEEWSRFWSEFATEPVVLALNGTNERKGERWDWGGAPAIGLAVDDIHRAAETCRQHKVRVVRGPVETSVCWMLFIEDPEGNRLVLHQRKNGTAS